jgi:hypothetical protein
MKKRDMKATVEEVRAVGKWEEGRWDGREADKALKHTHDTQT